MFDFNKWWLAPPAIVAALFGAKKIFLPTAKPGSTTPGQPAPTTPLKPITTKGATVLTDHLSDDFLIGLLALASYFNSHGSTISAIDLLAVFQVESGVLTRSTPEHPTGSHVVNSIGCAGLNQICATIKGQPLSGLRAVGFTGTVAQYVALKPEDQLRFVRGFFDTKNVYPKIHNQADLYLVNIAPAFIGAGPTTAVYRSPDPRYTGNAGMDIGKKGFITVADVSAFVARASHATGWDEAVSRINALRPIA